MSYLETDREVLVVTATAGIASVITMHPAIMDDKDIFVRLQKLNLEHQEICTRMAQFCDDREKNDASLAELVDRMLAQLGY